MISRRLIRTKALHMLYCHKKDAESTLLNTEKNLLYSINKSYDLYHLVLLLLKEFREISIKKMEIAINKNIPTEEDLNPNKKFIYNKLLIQIAEHPELIDYTKRNQISWDNQEIAVRKILADFISTPEFTEYMNGSEFSYKEDKDIIIFFLNKFLINNEDFFTLVEDEGIFWNDDTELAISMALRTVKKFKAEAPAHLMPKYTNDDDELYAKTLIRKALIDYQNHSNFIEKYTKNWEIDRIAFTDILILILGLTEAKEFSNIPVKVTINEYIELAKNYSTNKSGTFVNGILDRMISDLRKEKVILKSGRGLIGDE